MTENNFEYPSGILIPGTKYKVIRRLGAGGMGTVYEVEDTNIEKRYVLKTLHASLSSRADLAERMRREARALARLEHRNIVQVITADVTADSLRLTYLVMEKLSGHTLRTVLDNKTRLNVDTACRLSIDLLNALYHAHENRIIHRDVKPENIFLHRDADGTTVTKLLDFGIMTEADPEAHTQTGHNRFIGTLRYAAPEQLLGRPITPQSDIYAAGLCLYEIITGFGPFDDLHSSAEIANAHIQTVAPPLAKHVRVPRQLEDIVRRALAKDPAERQHDAFTFTAELNRFRKSQQSALELSPLSQVETVNDPFYLSTDPGAQQRAGVSGAPFSRPATGAGSPPPGAPPIIVGGGGLPYPGGGAQAAHALQPSPAPQGSETGGSGVRPSGIGTGENGPAHRGSSDPGRARSSALADAPTEFDDGEGNAPAPSQFSAGAPGSPAQFTPMVRGSETHENASPAPMTGGGATPLPAAGLRAGTPQPQAVDRNAPTGTYAPPGAPRDVLRSGTAIMSSLDGAPRIEPSFSSDPGVPAQAAPHPGALAAHGALEYPRHQGPLHAGGAAHAYAPAPAKRSLGPAIWIAVAGALVGAALAIGGVYHLSTRNAKALPDPATSASVSASLASAAPAPDPAPAKVLPAAENAAAAATAASADAGGAVGTAPANGAPAAAAPASGDGAKQTASASPTTDDHTHSSHRPREPSHSASSAPPPPAATKKLPSSGL